jgi:hypothetical protein
MKKTGGDPKIAAGFFMPGCRPDATLRAAQPKVKA